MDEQNKTDNILHSKNLAGHVLRTNLYSKNIMYI